MSEIKQNEVRQIVLGVPAGNTGYSKALGILGAVFVLATATFCQALLSAPSEARWGFLVVNFIYFLGVSQFGVAFSAIMRISGAKWARPYYRVAEIATLAFFPLAIAGLLFIYAYGRTHLFYWLEGEQAHQSAWLESSFLLYRNLLAQLVFYAVAFWYFMMGLLPDIRPEDAATGPVWRQNLYQRLLVWKEKWGAAALQRGAYYFSPIVLVVAVVPNTFIAWDFAMMLIKHYESTIFPMHFIMGNMFAGTAALLFLAVLVSRVLDAGDYFKTPQVHSVAICLTAFMLLWLYMFWAQFLVSWYGNMAHEYGVVSRYMYGHYAPYFWTMILCNFFIPLGCMIFIEFKNTWWTMVSLATLINVGVWLHRYLIVIPELAADHRPFASFPEIAMTVGLLAGFLFVLLLAFKVFPMVSMWELRAVQEHH